MEVMSVTDDECLGGLMLSPVGVSKLVEEQYLAEKCVELEIGYTSAVAA